MDKGNLKWKSKLSAKVGDFDVEILIPIASDHENP